MIARRGFLGALAVAPVLVASAGEAAGWPPAPLRIIADQRLDGGRALTALAAAQGLACADPAGEIIHLLRGPAQAWLQDGGLIGLTRWSDYALAADIARHHGRRIQFAAITGPDGLRALTPVPAAPTALVARARALFTTAARFSHHEAIGWVI